MRVEKAKIGEVVLNKVNGRKYIIDSIEADAFSNPEAKATLYVPEGESVFTDSTEETTEEILRDVTITSLNDRVYRHLFNTVKEAVYKTADISNGEFKIDGNKVETGEIKPAEIIATYENNVVILAEAETPRVYTYNVRDDRFVLIMEDGNMEPKIEYITIGDKAVSVVTFAELTPEPEDEDIVKKDNVATSYIVYERKDGKVYTCLLGSYSFDNVVNNIVVYNLGKKECGLGLSSDKAAHYVVVREDDGIETVKSYAIPSLPKYTDSKFIIGDDYVLYMPTSLMIDSVSTDRINSLGNIIILFEVTQESNSTELAFTNNAMDRVVTLRQERTADRGIVKTVA